MNMTEEQPQIRINPEEIEVEAERAAAVAAAATAGEVFDDLEEAAAREGKEADAGKAADNTTSVDGSIPATKRCNRRSGFIVGSSILLLIAALVGGGYSLQRSRNQISTAMMDAPDCKDGKFGANDLATAAGSQPTRRLKGQGKGPTTRRLQKMQKKGTKKVNKCAEKSCTSDDVGIFIKDKQVVNTLKGADRWLRKNTPLSIAAATNTFMEVIVMSSLKAAVSRANKEKEPKAKKLRVEDFDVAFALTQVSFEYGMQFGEFTHFDLEVEKAAKNFVKLLQQKGDNTKEQKGGGIEFSKNALEQVALAVDNFGFSVFREARMISKITSKKKISAKHVIKAIKTVAPKSLQPGISAALLNAIVSCGCQGKINTSKLSNWLGRLGMRQTDIMTGRHVFRTEATVAFDQLRKATVLGVLDEVISSEEAFNELEDEGEGMMVITENHILRSVSENSELNPYYDRVIQSPDADFMRLPSIQVDTLVDTMDMNFRLTAGAVNVVEKFSNGALYYTADKVSEYADQEEMTNINLDVVKGVVEKETPTVIFQKFNPMVEDAMRSLRKCKQDLEIDNDE
jgi:hypothetical protein